ncbi:YbjN domain-containing protein [Lusitaniella coriacea LEGE 07157]|uniref:YbjN domain-containing protein n=1 Tax=Lusitaniella coriacea LEGE 07157 TaxID=945747 RepID=A0A8J7B088_9CYAN|nr:YbjN domain-containing protein [Lusitaniella coriacea]MBE9114720.1 YbjN domain-containing protein [Lusitaniella coriacea LEGE 07157]
MPEETLETAASESQIEEAAIADELIEETTSHAEVIETVISSLDASDTAMVSRGEGGNIWKFQYGTVEVFVQMTGEAEEDIFTVWASVLALPVNDEPKLFRKLLEMNWNSTFEASFGICDNKIAISAQRTVTDLSPEEISRAITLVAGIADENNELLQAEFGQ